MRLYKRRFVVLCSLSQVSKPKIPSPPFLSRSRSLASPSSKMISPDAARNVVGIIGNVISFGLFLSPVPTFWRICKKKDVEEFKADPYLATLLNCMLWVFYGIPVVHPNSILVVTINGIGLIVEATYLVIFFLYSPNKKRLRMMAVLGVELVFMVAVILGVLLGAHTHEKRSMIVGILCVFFGSIMYFSPLTIMGKVIKTKSVEYMPFFLSLVCFLNGVCWTAYALIRFDIYVTIPNGLGALFGAVQLILYACYYRTTPKKTKAAAAKDVELPSVVSGPGAAGGGSVVSVTVER